MSDTGDPGSQAHSIVSLSPAEDFVAGAAGGLCECLSGHPLDTVKVRMQTAAPESLGRRMTVAGTLHSIAQAEGLRGLYRGVSSPLAGLVLINACMFSSFEAASRHLRALEGSPQLSLRGTFFAGCTSGAFTTLAESPVDLVKVQLQRQRPGHPVVYRGYFDCCRCVLQSGGLAGMYQGAAATLCRNVPGQGFHFLAYEATLRALHGPDEPQRCKALPATTVLSAGSMAGLALWISTYPFDVLKTMLQSQPLRRSERQYAGLWDCATATVKQRGVRVLFVGLNACIARSVPSTAACFWGYECTATWLAHPEKQ
jgi:solute carrier family 25 carnitine/acylcarnitine transporter 20/29